MRVYLRRERRPYRTQGVQLWIGGFGLLVWPRLRRLS
jgi:hypothetical protein